LMDSPMPTQTSVLVVLLTLFVGELYAQDPDPETSRQRAAEQRRAEEVQKNIESSRKKMDGILNGNPLVTPSEIAEARRQTELLKLQPILKFNNALRTFDDSRHQLETALGLESSLKEPAKGLEKSSGIILRFVKDLHKRRARFNSAEFRAYKSSDLAWEVLTTSERIAPQLGELMEEKNAGQVDVRFLQALIKLEEDLLRLQWLVKHLN